MKASQVMFYGNVQKATTLLGCVQASIEGIAKDISKSGTASGPLLRRYLEELEEIERDIVALLNAARTDQNSRDPRDGSWSESESDRDVL